MHKINAHNKNSLYQKVEAISIKAYGYSPFARAAAAS